MSNLIKAIQTLENRWHNDFKAFPFEDVDLFIYDEDGEQTGEIDMQELEFAVVGLMIYCENRAQDQDEMQSCFESWYEVLGNWKENYL